MLQKVVIVRTDSFEEVEWDASASHLYELLDIKKKDKFDKLIIEDDCAFVEKDGDYQSALFDFDGCMRDQEIVVVGLSNIADSKPIPTLTEVENRVQFRTYGVLNDVN